MQGHHLSKNLRIDSYRFHTAWFQNRHIKTAPNLGAVLIEYLLKVNFKNISSIYFIRTTSLFFIIF